MLANLVRLGIRWDLEGAALMGEMQIIKLDTGERTTYQIDGTVIKEQEPLKIDWCDKCEKWKDMEFGRYEKADGLTILWFCAECK